MSDNQAETALAGVVVTGEAKEALELDELKALCAAASEGPWDVDPERWAPPEWPIDTAYLRIVTGEPNTISGIRRPVVSTGGAREGTAFDRQHYSDARFIAASRTAVPSLIAEVERLRAQRDEALAIAQESTRRHEGGHPANYTALMDIVRVLSRIEDGTND